MTPGCAHRAFIVPVSVREAGFVLVLVRFFENSGHTFGSTLSCAAALFIILIAAGPKSLPVSSSRRFRVGSGDESFTVTACLASRKGLPDRSFCEQASEWRRAASGCRLLPFRDLR